MKTDMWDTDTKIFDWARLSEDRRILLDKLFAEFHIPEKGIAFILDKNDYLDYPNQLWRYQGVHMNIKLDGLEEISPDPLLEIMKSDNYSNLIWLSNRICLGDAVTFVWVASHELQHFMQDKKCHILSVAGSFLYNNLSHQSIKIDEEKEALIVPYEFDAELEAYKAVNKLIGKKQANGFIQNPENQDRMKRLQNHDFSKPYNVLVETIQFFIKYRNELVRYVNSSEDQFVRAFNVNKVICELKECLEQQ